MKGSISLTLLLGVPALLSAIELQPATVDAWDSYIQRADVRMKARIDGQQPFLWTEESDNRMQRVQRGQVVIAPIAGDGTQSVPNGLIHDWIGAVFIPGATIDTLFSVMHDYDRYKDFYRPAVVESKALSCTSDNQEFSMIWKQRALFVTSVVQSAYQARDVVVDGRRGYNVADTTRVQQIENYGHTDAHLLAPDSGNGFMWRLHSVARYEERDGGVYLELEAIALSRDIPASLRGLVKPVVNHISINSLIATLRETRDAVNSVTAAPKQVTHCPRTPGTVEALTSGGD